MHARNNIENSQSGFTLIELLVVIAIIALLFSLSTINLGHAQASTTEATSTDTLLADLKNEQLLSMAGDEGTTGTAQPHGIYINANSYTLFVGSSYNSSDPSNYTINLNGLSISTSFPDNQVIFDKGDGAVSGFTAGDNTITLSNGDTSTTISVNRFGATAVN